MANAKLKKLRIEKVAFQIEGMEPGLLCCRAPDEIIKGRKDDRTDEQKLDDTLYYLDPPRDGTEFGFPAQGIKACLSNGARFIGDKFIGPKIRGGLFVIGGPDGLLPLHGEWKELRVSAKAGRARITSIRARFEPGWTITVPIEFNPEAISTEFIVNLFEVSGFGCGIGNWRPELKGGGPYGRFRVKVAG